MERWILLLLWILDCLILILRVHRLDGCKSIIMGMLIIGLRQRNMVLHLLCIEEIDHSILRGCIVLHKWGCLELLDRNDFFG